MKKKNKILQIDLSRWETEERLPIRIETIIVQMLILCNGDEEKVAKKLFLSKEKINMIYVQYYFQIIEIIKAKEKTLNTDRILKNAIIIYGKHVNAIKAAQNKSEFKQLSQGNINSLNKAIDRTIEIMEKNTNRYERNNNALMNQLVKSKQIELIESGKIENNIDYDKNTKSVFNMLEQYKQPATRRIAMKDLTTDENIIYPTGQECGINLQLTGLSKRLPEIIKHRKVYKPVSGVRAGHRLAFAYADDPDFNPEEYK